MRFFVSGQEFKPESGCDTSRRWLPDKPGVIPLALAASDLTVREFDHPAVGRSEPRPASFRSGIRALPRQGSMDRHVH